VPATFAYKVRDRSGQLVEGELEADNATVVAGKLRSMGYTPVSIQQRSAAGLAADLKIPGLGGRMKLKDVAVFSRQFATMINSGLSLMRSLAILAEQTENKKLAAIVGEVRIDVEKGSSLSAALARHPKAFSRLYVAMVRSGEASGALDSVLVRLAETIEKQVELRRKIKSAMTYPVAVLGLVLVICAAMLMFVVPTFKGLFTELHGTLPLPTRVLLAVSSLSVRFAPFIVIAAVGAVVGFRRWLGSPGGRARWDTMKLRAPIVGRLVHKTAMTRFARTLAVLLRSGVPILEALEITADTVDNTEVAIAIRDVEDGVKRGQSIAGRLATHDIFPPMVTQMLAVGEETGAVDHMLDKVADFYDQEIEASVDALTSLLEPLLVVILGGVVGGMVVALYMPMFQIINLVK
jgi:type IV pilus assembly protein PilC